MRYMKLKRLIEFCTLITALAFAAPSFADGCFNPFDPLTDNTFVTQYGGADLSCPSAGAGAGYEECVFTIKNGNVDPISTDCIALGIDIIKVSDTEGLIWESSAGEPNSVIPANKKVDAILTDSAQGGKGCLYSFGTDQSGGAVGYERSNGNFFPPTKAVFCSDGVAETTAVFEPTPEVKNCILEVDENGNSVPKVIHGVDFSCQGVEKGATRTIIVIKDTQNCDVNGENCEEVPAFGFTDGAGNIDFNNVCRCVGNDFTSGELPDILACEPDPEDPNGPGCEVVDAEVPVDISIQNPKCFTVGGKRRCY
ncbi:MAG: hypothetical protein ACR2QW_15670 [bacterium]